MAEASADLPTVSRWLVGLFAILPVTMHAKEAGDRIRAYAPILARDYPAAAFCVDSFQACAREVTFLPSVAELHKRIGEWWEEHRPRPPSLMPPEAIEAPVDIPGRGWIALWLRRSAEGNGEAQAVALDLIRQQHADAFAWIVSRYPKAEAIAAQRKWPVVAGEAREAELRAEWSNPARIAEAVTVAVADQAQAAVALRLLRAVVGRHAPHMAALVPAWPLESEPRDPPTIDMLALPPPPGGQVPRFAWSREVAE